MDWFEPIDQYCERLDASFFGEPLNLFTNFAFIAASFLLFLSIRSSRKATLRPGSIFLVAMIFVIGVGSAIFHSVATRWAMFADVIPIGIFLVSYLYCFIRWEAGFSNLGALGGLCIFGLLTALTASIANHDLANGSEMYFGAWTSLFGIGCFMVGKRRTSGRWLTLVSSAVFSVSLLLRTMDMRVCPIWSYGTHFGWHTLNGIVLYLVTKSYLLGARKAVFTNF